MAETYLLEKLKSVEETFHELTRSLADPDTANNPYEYQRLAKVLSGLEEVMETYNNWKTANSELEGAKEVLRESQNDLELQEIATLEVQELEESERKLSASGGKLLSGPLWPSYNSPPAVSFPSPTESSPLVPSLARQPSVPAAQRAFSA